MSLTCLLPLATAHGQLYSPPVRQPWPPPPDGVSGEPLRVRRRQTTFRNQPFRPLPRPAGDPPFHLSLENVLSPAQMAAIRSAGKLVFHIIGDTGGVRSPFAQ